MVIVLVAFQFAITLSLIGLNVYQFIENRKQVSELTSKIVAKSLTEFSSVKAAETPAPKKEKAAKPLVDPVLGKVF